MRASEQKQDADAVSVRAYQEMRMVILSQHEVLVMSSQASDDGIAARGEEVLV